ncbi:MAG: peptidylprolyl isomerase [Deltaproteobacteria bacterium]|nr:peptidylprolyl isomerase [Deltaproteobacteria bacterium]MBW2071853.1 peptidylprolyl isomerase [Deltaproteobacteria bacterium]
MAQAKVGDKVRVHYEGKLNDGTVFDSSIEREPIEFVIGQNMVIQGFENAVVGMEVGESKSVSLAAEEAFGEHRDDLVVDIEKKLIPPHIDPQLGMQLELTSDEGTKRFFTITRVDEETVTLDGNHPLAGKEIMIKVDLVEIL